MSRSFRIYQKKRGHRRTGSTTVARAGELIFYGLFFLGGCIGLAVIPLLFIVPEWRANNEFVKTNCVVVSKAVAESHGDDGATYRPNIAIEYAVNGITYHEATYDIGKSPSPDREAQQTIVDQFEVGKSYDCWYDPRDPRTVVLARGYSRWTWMVLIIPVSFVLIGGGGFVFRAWNWGKSAEYSAATAAGPIMLRLGDAALANGNPFPTVPPSTDMANSPGTTLAFRLPISTSTTFGLLVVLIAAILWNGVVGAFLYGVIAGFLAGKSPWLDAIFVAPFALAGLFLVYYFFRRLLITTGVGPTLLEISDHPLYPGETYELFLSQAGRLRLRGLELSLVGTEEVRYRQGTDTRTEQRCIHRESLFCQKKFDIRRGVPFETRCDLRVPPGLMHSFKSENNALTWTLVVEGKVAGWPDYRRSFPIVIHPESAGRRDA
ncbi:MAG: DUF3592 domain-containing protein [Pirellulaceae bacterium]|nr:DUF3592 domain-containing protein [Pirellulaceae bacterium]